MAEERIAAWVDESCGTHPAFFDLPPTSDYTFNASPADLQQQEAGTCV